MRSNDGSDEYSLYLLAVAAALNALSLIFQARNFGVY